MESLQYLIDPDHGLLEKLRRRKALSLEDAEKIRHKDTYIERNRMVLHCVNRDKKLDDFLLALRETDQSHVANFIHYNGGYNKDVESEWPLTEREIMILDINDSLIDIIDPDNGLLDKLLAEKVINGRQWETISSKPTIHERNSSLLSFLRRRSVRDYWKMIQCLSDTNQGHIAEILDEEGVALDVHADISVRGNAQNTSDIEEQISTQLSEVILAKIPNSSIEYTRQILRSVNFKVIAAKKGQSIVLYVYCKVMEDLDHVQDLITSGEINSVLNRIFVRCLSFLVTLDVKTRTINSTKLAAARNFIKDFENQQKSSIELLKPNLSKTNFCCFPQEVLTTILTNVVLVRMYYENTAKPKGDVTIFTGLASVAPRWFKSLKTRYLKNSIMRFSKVYFQRLKLRSTIIRNNQNFLKEVLHLDEIIIRLESQGCLTEHQVTFRRRLKTYKDKNNELLFMLQDFSSHEYSNFVDCLFVTNQIPAALVLERGGVTLKVHISNGKEIWKREFELKLIEIFQRMQTENTLIFNDLLNASDENGMNDVFILHAKQNKGIELWFWCKTESSLNQLKSLSDEALREIIQRMYQRLIPEHSTSLEPQLIQRDSTFACDFAERRLSFRHVKNRHSLILSGYSQCVTSLEDKIYVARREDILRFQNKYPFQALKSIEFSEPVYPFSIASCRINKCLYMSADANNNSGSVVCCMYKIEPEFDNRLTKWQHDTSSCPISVTSKGYVLAFHIRRAENMLRVFTPEGAVKRAISIEYGLRNAQSIQEIMPDIVALSYARSCVAIMRLDENGTILRRIKRKQEIVCLSSFRYGDPLIGIPGYKNAALNNSAVQNFNSDLIGLVPGNDKKASEVLLLHCVLDSKFARNLVTTDERMCSIHFASDQKQLYVLYTNRLCIYQLNYGDENYDKKDPFR